MSQPLTPLRRICFLLSHLDTASGEDVILLQIELGSTQAPADEDNVENTGQLCIADTSIVVFQVCT